MIITLKARTDMIVQTKDGWYWSFTTHKQTTSEVIVNVPKIMFKLKDLTFSSLCDKYHDNTAITMTQYVVITTYTVDVHFTEWKT